MRTDVLTSALCAARMAPETPLDEPLVTKTSFGSYNLSEWARYIPYGGRI